MLKDFIVLVLQILYALTVTIIVLALIEFIKAKLEKRTKEDKNDKA